MKEELIKLETAKLAKERGFGEEGIYLRKNNPSNNVLNWDSHIFCDSIPMDNNSIKAILCKEILARPSQSLLQRWLREVHNIHIDILPRYHPKKLNTDKILFSYSISTKDNNFSGYDDNLNHWIGIHAGPPFVEDVFYHMKDTYELALEEGLKEALIMIEKKSDVELN